MGKREDAIKRFEEIYGQDITYRDVAARVDAFYGNHRDVNADPTQAVARRSVLPRPAFICGLLALVTLALYWRVSSFPFIVFDDQEYITSNPRVQGGLTPSGILWPSRPFTPATGTRSPGCRICSTQSFHAQPRRATYRECPAAYGQCVPGVLSLRALLRSGSSPAFSLRIARSH